MSLISDIHLGVLDSELAEIQQALNSRRHLIQLMKAADNLGTLQIGERVRTTGIRPNYLNNRPCTVIGFDGDKIKVDMGQRIGKYGQELSIYAACLVR